MATQANRASTRQTTALERIASIESELEAALSNLRALKGYLQTEVVDVHAPLLGGLVPPSKASAAVLEFPIVGPAGPTWELQADQVQEWGVLFPGVDILAECRKALAWVSANQRKTASGMPRFLVSWITRAVNNGKAAKIGKHVPPAAGVQTAEQRARQQTREQTNQHTLEVAKAYVATLSGPALSDLEEEAKQMLRGYEGSMQSATYDAKVREAMVLIAQRHMLKRPV